MITIHAKRYAEHIPPWAILEKRLIDAMNETPPLVMGKYVRPNGHMLWPADDNYTSIDALDDMYESFHNWPLFYFLGGSEAFRTLSHRQFDAITAQFAQYDCGHGHPMVVKEYEQGYDWMHQSEGYLFFYLLNLADPNHAASKARSLRFAGFLLNEDADAVNYNPESRTLGSCYTGSRGATHRNFDDFVWDWADWKPLFGLPFNDVPGIATVDDVRDPANAQRMGDVLRARLAHSDTIINLLSTTMVMNAYLHTGEDKYRQWVLDYAAAWRERTEANGGLVPDNCGQSGRVGENMNGKWYGGHYGWTWPHGFYFIADALTVACENETLLTGDIHKIDWMRAQYAQLEARAIPKDGTLYFPQKHGDPDAVQEYQASPDYYLSVAEKTSANPLYTRLLQIDGWFEFSPLPPIQPAHMWFLSREGRDMDFLRRIRHAKTREWEQVKPMGSKYQGGQDAAWLHYLEGGFADYPETILQHNLSQVYARVKFMREDTEPVADYTDSYLQKRNPVSVEGLVQLTLGGPMPIYNGGLLMVSVCYFDLDENRFGLPEGIAALVSHIDAAGIDLELVNLSLSSPRAMLVQAGAFGEHRFTQVSADGETYAVNDTHFTVRMEPGAMVHLRLDMERFCNRPQYHWPGEVLA